MTRAWNKYYVCGSSSNAYPPCVLGRYPDAAAAAEHISIKALRRGGWLRPNWATGVYVNLQLPRWNELGLHWSAVEGEGDFSAATERRATTFVWTHRVDRRGFFEVECVSRPEIAGQAVHPDRNYPRRLMRLLHCDKRGDDRLFWSVSVQPKRIRETRSKVVDAACREIEMLHDWCREQNMFDLAFRHGV